jgi:hypothetical protein
MQTPSKHMINWPTETNIVKNKYSTWYEQIIENACTRVLPTGTYTELHHIIPKSFGGPNTKENLVSLTAREHFIVHALLWKFNIAKHYHIKMLHAFHAMCNFRNSNLNKKPAYKINSRIFTQLKLERHVLFTTDPEIQARLKLVAREIGRRPKGENFKRLTGLRFKGRTDTVGEKNGNFGNKWTQEMKDAMSQFKSGKTLSPIALQNRREKMSKTQYVCEHCKKSTTIKTNYIRWHGDLCRHRP